MKVRKYRKSNVVKYSISDLSSDEFKFLAHIMSSLKFDIPVSKRFGNISLPYDRFTAVAPPFCNTRECFRSLGMCVGVFSSDNYCAETTFKFDIDDVL